MQKFKLNLAATNSKVSAYYTGEFFFLQNFIVQVIHKGMFYLNDDGI